MSLPVKVKKDEPKPVSVTVRLTLDTSNYLKLLAKSHGLSQGDVIEHLVKAEYKKWERRIKKKEN